jgi:hypothetical protein
MTDDSGLLAYELARGEDSEVRDSPDIEPGGQLLLLVGVDLQNNGTTRHISRCSCHLRSRRVTWSTPFRPEIDEYGNLRAVKDLIKELLIDRKRFVDRR